MHDYFVIFILYTTTTTRSIAISEASEAQQHKNKLLQVYLTKACFSSQPNVMIESSKNNNIMK